jgi:hypothetical protein
MRRFASGRGGFPNLNIQRAVQAAFGTMQYSRTDFPLLNIFPPAGMAAVDADVEMYKSAVTFIQGIFVVHGLQLRVVQNKDVHALKIPASADKNRLSYNFSNAGGQDSPGNHLYSWTINAYSISRTTPASPGKGATSTCHGGDPDAPDNVNKVLEKLNELVTRYGIVASTSADAI